MTELQKISIINEVYDNVRFPPAPVAEPDPRDYVVVPLEYFAEDEEYVASMFRTATEEVTLLLA